MGINHKHTHRPLALLVLFVLLGLIGWQLPRLGSTTLAYSTRALQAVQSAVGALRTAPASAAPAPASLYVPAQGSQLTAEQTKQLAMLLEDRKNGAGFSQEENYVLDRFRDGVALRSIEADTVASRVLYNLFVLKRGFSRSHNQLLSLYRNFVAQQGRQILDETNPNPGKGATGGLMGGEAGVNKTAAPLAAITTGFAEGFNVVPPAGWFTQNNSAPVGVTGWFQGNTTVFPAQAGPADSYVGANFNNTGSVGTISNWLLTPELALKNGDQIKFWTRIPDGTEFPDRLEVRMSTAGAGTNVGADSTSVGSFTTLLLSINPALTTGVYPKVFTQFTATVSGLGAPTTGRIGFRYFVTDGGVNGTNSNYIGIDSFEYVPLLPVTIVAAGATVATESCPPSNNVADPGETVTVNLCLQNTGAGTPTNVVATMPQDPVNGVLAPSGPQSYGALAPGGAAVCRPFTFTVPSSAVCGGKVTARLNLADGATGLGSVTYDINIGVSTPTTTSTFTQAAPITIPATVGSASPYPSALSVVGVTGTVTGLKVRLTGVNHTFPDDVDVMLVGPTGASLVLMSDAGGGTDLVGTNLEFADRSAYLPDSTAIASGAFAPTNIGTGDSFAAPAPAPGAGAPLNTTFAGLDPNGTWNLFVTDDTTGDGGSITSWSLEFTTVPVAPVVATTSFSNTAAISIPTLGNATPYPSTISVTGLTGAIRNIEVKLNGLNHTFPVDMDMMLVSPTGQGYILASDAGGFSALTASTVTIRDSAVLNSASYAGSPTISPVNISTGDAFPAPAPGTPKSAPTAGADSLLGTFGAANPNGVWSLFIVDDVSGDGGGLSGGWTLSFTTVTVPATCSTCASLCTITPPANITVNVAPGMCAQTVTYAAPVTSGTCGAVTCTPASGSSFPKGTTTVSCLSESGGGYATFTVTVVDNIAPVITCPANITVGTTTACSAVVTYPAPAVTDNCPGVGAPVCTPASGSTFAVGTTTVNCKVTDAVGLMASCSFTVTVNDTTPPTITCPQPIFVGTTGATAVVTYPAPAIADNCPGATVTCTPASGSSFPVGVTTVTCTAKDAANNTASCSFPITVNKETALTLTDPLACTGPGNVLKGSFALSNNGNVSQNVTASAALPPTLLALPGTCTATIGTCTIVSASSITWSGTLSPGQTATITYEAQVADAVLTGTPMTVTTTATWNGGPPLVVNTTATVTCGAVGPGTPFQSGSPLSDQKAGSVLIYPIYTSSASQNNQNSRVAMTNLHPSLPAYVHLYFVANDCAVSDAFICLTPNQTTSFLASDLDPGSTGYLVAVAVDGRTGCPINFNYLIGDEYVKFSSGHAANLGAEAVSAIAGSSFWSSFACNASTVAAVLRFDGISYGMLPTTVAVDNVGSRADGNDTMLVLSSVGGDLRTGPSTLGSVFGVLYDDSEAAFSFSFTANQCQFRTSLNNSTPRTTPPFTQVIPAGRVGWMRLWHRNQLPLIGAAINFNSNAAANSNAFNQGHNLHKLTLTNTGVWTVPVFPPTC
jgi:subtilisin-like proprotein convertase family protein